MYVFTPQEMRVLDKITIKDFGLPGILLMESAGRDTYITIRERYDLTDETLVTVICGRGNNGGDGFVTARYLLNRVGEVKVFLLGNREQVKGDARFHMELFEKAGGEIIQVSEDNFHLLVSYAMTSNIIVDAIFGTGFKGKPEGLYEQTIDLINESPANVVSIDIPSGVDGESGGVNGTAVVADVTVTMGYPKTGHYLYPGRLLKGELVIADIGIPEYIAKSKSNKELITSDLARGLLPMRYGPENKGDFGRVLVVSGSKGYTGAAALTAMSALVSGAGLVYLAIPESLNPIMEQKLTEVITIPVAEKNGRITKDALSDLKNSGIRFDVLAIGPGLGRTEEVKEAVVEILNWFGGPMVIDADAFVLYYGDGKKLEKEFTPIVTPHPGELGRVLQVDPREIDRDRLVVAPEFAKKASAITLLKGNPSVVALPNGKTYINITGNPGLASGGTGDVLTGIIAGLLAQGLEPQNAALLGVFLHGLSGDLVAIKETQYTLVASKLIDTLPTAYRLLQGIDLEDEEE